ncbi:MAG: leucine-rich repeat domain-containing protein, partial [Clostridia bacterium]|nr:leucine-rich repeat domain-containing protein [Clostridia bacterium]
MKRLLAILTVICLALCFLTACREEVEEPEPSPTPVIISGGDDTKLPDIELEYDATKFVMEGVVLVAYIGGEEAVEIPDGTMIIGANAFKDCKKMKSVKLVDTLTQIDRCAFEGCTSLETVAIPKLVKVVGEYAFRGCTALQTAEMKTNATNVGRGCFEDCTALEKITFSSSMVTVNDAICK